MKLLVFLFPMMVWSQITLKPCIDPRASILIQELNVTKDSLFLKSEFPIKTVTMIGDKFGKHIKVDHFETKIPLSELTRGRTFIQVVTNGKIITLNIEKE